MRTAPLPLQSSDVGLQEPKSNVKFSASTKRTRRRLTAHHHACELNSQKTLSVLLSYPFLALLPRLLPHPVPNLVIASCHPLLKSCWDPLVQETTKLNCSVIHETKQHEKSEKDQRLVQPLRDSDGKSCTEHNAGEQEGVTRRKMVGRLDECMSSYRFTLLIRSGVFSNYGGSATKGEPPQVTHDLLLHFLLAQFSFSSPCFVRMSLIKMQRCLSE